MAPSIEEMITEAASASPSPPSYRTQELRIAQPGEMAPRIVRIERTRLIQMTKRQATRSTWKAAGVWSSWISGESWERLQ